jgi:hypothetical protein
MRRGLKRLFPALSGGMTSNGAATALRERFMETWLILRLIGGLSFAIAHRVIVRRAWQESSTWGICAMLIPGVSFLFAFRYRLDLGKPLIVQIAGMFLVFIGFAVALGQSFGPAHAAPLPVTPEEHAEAAPPPASPPAQIQKEKDLAAWFADLNSRRADLKTQEEIKAYNEEAARYSAALAEAKRAAEAAKAAASPASIPPAQSAVAITEPPGGLFAWGVALEEKRKTLNAADPEAVRKFNEEVAAYHAALTPRKELKDELRPLRDELRPLQGRP